MIYRADQLTGFYMMGALLVKELSELINFYSRRDHRKTYGFQLISENIEVNLFA